MKIYYNKRKRLDKKRDPPDWFGAPTWPPFYCFGKPIWRTWSHVKRVSESCHNLQCDLPWVPEVLLAYGGNFRCWPKADTSLAVGHSHEGRSRKKNARVIIKTWQKPDTKLEKSLAPRVSATGKTLNTWNISGMFIVLWPITAKTKARELAANPQTNPLG